MIKSIRQQTKNISTNWFQIGKYIIVFVIGILICRGLQIRNYEYLNSDEFVASSNTNLKVVSENNFEPGKWPFDNNQGTMPVNNKNNNQGTMPINKRNNNRNNNNIKEVTVFPRSSGKVVSSNNFKPGRSPTNKRNNNQGTKPVNMPSPKNTSGAVSMPSPTNTSGETGLAAECRAANWIPRNECNSKSSRNTPPTRRAFSGFGLAQQLGGPGNTTIEAFTSGREYFNINTVTGEGFRDSPTDTSITTSFAGTNYDINMDSFGNSNLYEYKSPEVVVEDNEWQCNQFQDDKSNPTCIEVNSETGTPIITSDTSWTETNSNSNPFIKLCEENGCVDADGTELSSDDIKGLLTQFYDGSNSNPPWFTESWISWAIPIKEDIRVPGHEEKSECNKMIYDDNTGVLEGVMRCHNNKFEVSISTMGGVIICVVGILILVGVVVYGNSSSKTTTTTTTPTPTYIGEPIQQLGGSAGGLIMALVGLFGIIIIGYGGVIILANTTTGPDGTGDPEGPNRTLCVDSICKNDEGYKRNDQEFGEGIDQCCKPIEDTCRYWWDNGGGECSEGQDEFTPQAGAEYDEGKEQDICCAITCSPTNDCGQGLECKEDNFCYEKNDPENCEEWFENDNICPDDSEPVENPVNVSNPNKDECCINTSGTGP